MTELVNTSANELGQAGGNRIRDLNDNLRRSLSGGRVVMTNGVAVLGEQLVARIVQAVRSFDGFDPDNDPHGEHDFGSFEIDGEKLFFKIDYYDKTLTFGSPDPSNPTITERVLTIMLASEY